MPTNSIFPEANVDVHEKKIGDLVAALRTELDDTLTRAQTLAGEPATKESVDGLLRLHFAGTRLARRLRALGEDGLITLTAERVEDAEGIVQNVLNEVRDECRRRCISIEVTVSENLGSAWLDREQITEAVRCLLDDAMRGAAPGSHVDVQVNKEMGGVAFSVSYRQAGVDYNRALRDEHALMVAHCIASSAHGVLVREHRGPWSETSLWIPQQDAGYAEIPSAQKSACAVAA